MGRTLKEHDVRKAELIDAAWGLFKTNGYDSTPVSAIIDKVGVAKGTFYHYFSSKEEILDDAIARETSKVMDNLQPVLDDNSLSPVEKLKAFMSAFSAWKLQNAAMLVDIFRVVYRPENIVVREKMNRKVLEIVVP
ncbi:MAG: TetR/AcrR family transcriptional regulator, partial [Actinobacteria bacterium]|nr:TetR/AcrR family transcriptional regulator [Actinomycetota bacterium]